MVEQVKPRLLDGFCNAGGAAKGYQRAGFYVVGVDIEPQPNYCGDEFIRADMLTYPLTGFDAIHVSPVCLTFARVTDWRGSRGNYPDTLTPMLARLAAVDIPWVAENVLEACPPLRPDLIMCGSQFGLNVHRRRAFQLGNWSAFDLVPPCTCAANRELRPFMHKGERAFADAMGCTWMTNLEARQAIPPAYTERIGELLMDHLARAPGTSAYG